MTDLRLIFLVRSIRAWVSMLPFLVITVYSQAQPQGNESQANSAKVIDGFRTIEWPDLMPKEDLEALLNPPDALDEIEDGTMEDQIAGRLQIEIEQESGSRYQQALVSTRVVEAFNGQSIRLPGFIVPLEYGEDGQHITKFFLVPYFGACIHQPPPPPNQIVYAAYGKGFKLESLYEPFWLSGVLGTKLIENDLATAAYTLKVKRIEPYLEQ